VHETAADQVGPGAEGETGTTGRRAYRAPRLTGLGTLADMTSSAPGSDVGFTISDGSTEGIVTGF
jgi:hypothetical protein